MSILVAEFWEHSNYSGNVVSIYGNIGLINVIADLAQYSGGTMNNKISSMKVYNLNFLVSIYKDAGFLGDKYHFRGPIEVPSLSSYGFNDNVTSIVVNGGIIDPNSKQGQGQIIVYKDSSNLGLSTWVAGPANYPDIRNSTFSNNGGFPNDSISSLRLYPNTRAILYKDSDYGSDSRTYTNDSMTGFVDTNVDLNDTCTSLKLEYYYP